MRGIEELPVHGGGAGAGAAMQEHDGHAIRAAAFLPIERVAVAHRETASAARLNGREERWRVAGGAAGIHWHGAKG